MRRNKFIIRWAIAWACLAGALGLHVADEALTGFLPFYNSIITLLRNTYGWVPLPTFTYGVWLGEFAPGVYSFPILLAAAIALVVTTRQTRHAQVP